MTELVSSLTTLISGIFEALINALASLGDLIFKTSAEGALSGLTPFGWLSVVFIGIPLATWLFNKAIGIFKMLRSK